MNKSMNELMCVCVYIGKCVCTHLCMSVSLYLCIAVGSGLLKFYRVSDGSRYI